MSKLAPDLYQRCDSNRRHRCFKGTEEMRQFPLSKINTVKGITCYGTIKDSKHPDVWCYETSIENSERLESVGYTVLDRRTYYATVTRFTKREVKK